MNLAPRNCFDRGRRLLFPAFILMIFGFPFAGAGAALGLGKEAPKTAREGNLIEYSLEVINQGATSVAGIRVLDALPVEVEFVQAVPTSGGTYDSITGIWTLPTLGTGANDTTAGLQLQALVKQNLVNNPDDVVSVTNQAEVIAPPDQIPAEAQVSTNIVCPFCIDWEIESVVFDEEVFAIDLDDYYAIEEIELRFLLRVEVANNGPVTSDGIVSATRFDIRGGGIGSIELFPTIPVAVTLAPGQSQTIQFSSDRVKLYDDYTLSWEFEVNDVALLDPVLPNTASGSYFEGLFGDGSDNGEGCFIATAAYGSYLDPHVVTLRDFRDKYLSTNTLGKWFINLYYQHSPPIADYIRERETFRALFRFVLTLVVYFIEYPVAAGLVLVLPLLIAVRRRKRREA